MAVGLRSPGRDLKGTSIQNAHKEYRRTCFPRLVQLSDPLASQCHPRECHHQPYQSRPGLLPVLSLRAPEGRHTKVFLRLPWQTSTSSPPQRPCQHCALSSVVVQFRTSPAPRALHARPCSIIVIGFGPAAVNYLAAGEVRAPLCAHALCSSPPPWLTLTGTPATRQV